jgi:TonB family protein
MIARTLVPVDIRLGAANGAPKQPRRLSSPLDERTVVPRDLPIAPIDPKTSIPSHVPLEVLSTRTLVPRGLPAKPLGEIPKIPEYVPLSVLDSRTVVPAYVEPATPEEIERFEQRPPVTRDLLEIVEPDLITTGEVNLLVRPVEERDAKWKAVSRIASLAFHFGLILLVLSSPRLFPAHVPTQDELDMARRQLSFVYLPPAPGEIRSAPRPAAPKMKIDPGILRRVAPPHPELSVPPAVTPPKEPSPAPSDLPSAPVPKTSTPEASPQPKPNVAPAQPLEIPKTPQPTPGKLNLSLPNLSPGKAIEQSAQGALQRGGGPSYRTEAPLPNEGGDGGGGGGGGGGQGKVGNGVQILSDTQGVDFNSYLQRLLASVQRNWYAVIPESARMGDRGKVFITFKIQPDGNVPFPDPTLERTSGKEPLDRAAMSAIRASSPFEPLPTAFHGPFLLLRFGFYYNLPIDYQ